MDKRKFNGGNSTKSKKAFDRRKRISLSDNDSFEMFFGQFKDNMMVFYESIYKAFLDTHVRHGECYVYFHYLDGKIVYVGKGQGERVFGWNRTNEEHSELVKNGTITPVIIANDLTEEMSLLIESALIKNLNPIYNGR
jgi:hypothetical protein